MSTDVALTDSGPRGRLVEWAAAARAAGELAEALCRTDFCPKQFQGKPAEAAAAIMLGDQLGLAPLAALSAVYVVGGTPTMYTRTKVALVLSRGHRVWTVRESDTEVTVAGLRAGDPEAKTESVTWTLTRATTAGLAGRNANYRTNPRAMLWARAAGEVCNRIAPDVLLGIAEAPADELVSQVDGPGVSATIQRAPGGQWRNHQAGDGAPVSDYGPTTPGPKAQVTARPTTDVALPADPVPDLTAAVEVPEGTTEGLTAAPMSAAQSRMIHALYGSLGYTDRTEYLNDISAVVGRLVTTSKELSRAEAGAVIDALVAQREEKDREQK